MSKLDEVKAAFLAVTQGLTAEEKLWAINAAFPDVVRDLIDVRVREEFNKRQAKDIFEDNDSNLTVDNTKAQYNIKYDDNIVEIRTEQNIDIDIYSSVENGYVGAGGMHFTYDNPEETTIRLIF